MYAVAVTFDIYLDQMDAFLPLMLENARTSRTVEPGCQQFDVCRSGNRIFLYEIYANRAAFDVHLTSDHFRQFDTAVTAMIESKKVELYEEVIR